MLTGSCPKGLLMCVKLHMCLNLYHIILWGWFKHHTYVWRKGLHSCKSVGMAHLPLPDSPPTVFPLANYLHTTVSPLFSLFGLAHHLQSGEALEELFPQPTAHRAGRWKGLSLLWGHLERVLSFLCDTNPTLNSQKQVTGAILGREKERKPPSILFVSGLGTREFWWRPVTSKKRWEWVREILFTSTAC